MSGKNSYITAASTPEGQGFGFVFRNCDLNAKSGVTSVYLGRPWRPWAQVVYLQTTMWSHINPVGWHNWDNPDNERTTYYAEYQTSGVSVGQRVSWSVQLTATEANRYSNGNILGGWIPPA
jgi:pectinesterase